MAANNADALTANAAASYTTSVNVSAVTPDGVVLSYNTLPGNQPSTYGNFIFGWDSKVIGYHRTPLVRMAIPSSQASGSIFVGNLSVVNTPYIFGYAVGPQVNDVCASAFIAPGQSSVNFSPSLMLTYVGTNVVVVRYDLPAGFDPAAAGSSVAIWKGQAPLYNVPPVASAPIASSSETGSLSISMMVLRGMTYAIAIVMTPSVTSLAAAITFTT